MPYKYTNEVEMQWGQETAFFDKFFLDSHSIYVSK
jgi:hypothetical protein